ncbi:MAG: SAM-dependent methyltransferase [Chloroflexi bacterium]|nr:SAM-dependent methyltransferase [Chloroflexota bacterium]
MSEQRILVEDARRLSESILWQLQRDYYAGEGIKAWKTDRVPHVVTNNAFLAKAYARIVYGFLRDWQHQIDRSEPVYVVELGAGTGRLAFGFLRKWLTFFPQSALRDIKLTYVITDFAEENVRFWQQHPTLKPYVDAGQLDFATFDATQPGPIHLRASGKTLNPGELANPLVVLANYFFDSLPQDTFALKGGTFYEGRVKVNRVVKEGEQSTGLDNLKLGFELAPADVDTYYSDPDYNAVLKPYAEIGDDTWVLFPITGFEVLRHLNALSGGRLLLLTADKGYHRWEDASQRHQPFFNLHGSFSLMVNYHALGEMMRRWGGDIITNSHTTIAIDICALTGPVSPDDYVETRQAYVEYAEELSPDDFYHLKVYARPGQTERVKPDEIIAHIRFSGYDPHVMLHHFAELFAQLESTTHVQRDELRIIAHKAYENYYEIGEPYDMAFACASLLSGAGFYEDALPYFHRSRETHGDAPETLYNLAICHACLTQYDDAIALTETLVERVPEHETYQRLLEQLRIQSAKTAAPD